MGSHRIHATGPRRSGSGGLVQREPAVRGSSLAACGAVDLRRRLSSLRGLADRAPGWLRHPSRRGHAGGLACGRTVPFDQGPSGRDWGRFRVPAQSRHRSGAHALGHTRELAGSAGISPERIDVVHCGADGGLYRPGLSTGALRERLGLAVGHIILTVGQLSRRKAQDTVIRALPSLVRDLGDVTYLVVGLPTRRAELAQLAAELGVEDHVLFLGQVPQQQLPLIYNLADVFVLVSRRTEGEVKGYGIVVAEAALCGVPAVVSRDSGLVEAIIEDETALVVPPDDPDATAEAIARHPQRR